MVEQYTSLFTLTHTHTAKLGDETNSQFCTRNNDLV